MRLVVCILACSFVGAHIVKIALTDPGRVLAHPEALLAPWRGIASFGGLLGGLLGGIAWMRFAGMSWRQAGQWLDIFAYVFPFPWILGRLGCTLAHDHLGRMTGSWLAVRYPGGPRYNLGLVELLYTLLLAGLFLVLDRRPRPAGLFFGLLGLLYGGFRLWLDTLHVDPPRLGGVTLDQIGGALTVLVGVTGWVLMSRCTAGARQASAVEVTEY